MYNYIKQKNQSVNEQNPEFCTLHIKYTGKLHIPHQCLLTIQVVLYYQTIEYVWGAPGGEFACDKMNECKIGSES